jgi:predicted alpha/beta-fold hydrolase
MISNSNTSQPITFSPPPWLRNPHIQSIVSSTLPRKLLVRRKAKTMLASTQQEIIQCNDGIRLLGEYSHNAANEKLLIMVHGWEGCIESNYMLSVAAHLYSQGYSVFRLNLRDHGNSSYLNERPYNSARLAEILDAMEQIQRLHPHQDNYLVGFSLGGNFSLRIAANAHQRKCCFNKIIAVCPVISPAHTMQSLATGLPLYHNHFVSLWKNSLINKLQHFPELGYEEKLKPLNTLQAMNEYFIPHLTDYDTLPAYFDAYSLGGKYLQDLSIPTHIITSSDDPVVLCEDLNLITPKPANLSIEITQYGGHCAFIENTKLDSWIDRRIDQLLQS